jgi:hypothetical protein
MLITLSKHVLAKQTHFIKNLKRNANNHTQCSNKCNKHMSLDMCILYRKFSFPCSSLNLGFSLLEYLNLFSHLYTTLSPLWTSSLWSKLPPLCHQLPKIKIFIGRGTPGANHLKREWSICIVIFFLTILFHELDLHGCELASLLSNLLGVS